jgi:hypothetical protein
MGLEEVEGDGAAHRTRPQPPEGLHPCDGHRGQNETRAQRAGELGEPLPGAMGCDLAAEVRHLYLDHSAPGALGLDTIRFLHGALPSGVLTPTILGLRGAYPLLPPAVKRYFANTSGS